MESNYRAIMDHVYFHEGGFVNNPKDPGGATNMGITQAVYNSYRNNKGLTVKGVRGITREEADDIYRLRYWNKIDGGELPSGVDYITMDSAVNSGIHQSALWLQRAINRLSTGTIKEDGEIGPTTIRMARQCDPAKLIDTICEMRLSFLQVIRHRTTKALLWPTFGGGWTNRIKGYKNKAGVRKGGVQAWSHALRLGTKEPEVIRPHLPPDIQGKKPISPAVVLVAIVIAVLIVIWRTVHG